VKNLLVIDDREHAVKPEMFARYDVPAQVERLEVGDYSFIDSQGDINLITRKSSDLPSSVYSHHFQEEISNMVTVINDLGGGRLWFIQEGTYALTPKGLAYWKYDYGRGWSEAWVHKGDSGTHLSMEISLGSIGVSTIHTANLIETIATLCRMYKKGQDNWPTSLTAGLPKRKITMRRDPRLSSLMGFWKGLSEKNAVAVLNEYKTMENFFKQAFKDPDAFKDIKGIGPKAVDKLKESL
jgi:ERCC4-type nuclease